MYERVCVCQCDQRQKECITAFTLFSATRVPLGGLSGGRMDCLQRNHSGGDDRLQKSSVRLCNFQNLCRTYDVCVLLIIAIITFPKGIKMRLQALDKYPSISSLYKN